MGLVNDIAGNIRTVKLPIAYGWHPVQGVPIKHIIEALNNDTRYIVHQALAEGPWHELMKLWWRGYEINGADYEFRNGTGNDAALTFFPYALAGEHPWAAHVAAKLPVGVPSDTDFQELFGIYKTLRLADYDDSGTQLDSDGNPVGGGDPRDYFFFDGIGTNPAHQTIDQIVRWGMRPKTIINWEAWRAWADWNATNIDEDDATFTPRYLRATAGITIGTIPAGTYYVKLVAVVGSEVSSSSREVEVVLAGPGSMDLNWDMKDDTGVTDYRLYYGTATGAQDHYVSLGVGGVSRTYTLTSLSTAVADGAPSMATTGLLRAVPRFATHVFFTPPYQLVDALDRICQLCCADWQWDNAQIKFMSPVDRVPIFTFNLAEIGKGTFKTYPPESRSQPNQVVLNYRNVDNEYIDFADPIIVPDPNLTSADPRIAKQIREGGVKPVTIEGGCMTHGQAQRVANYWYHSVVEMSRLADIDGSPKSYPALPADVVNITHDVPDWEDVMFKIITKQEKGVKTGDKMTLRLYQNGMYSDFAYVPLPNPLPPTPVNPFTPPAQVSDVTLTENNILQADQTVVTAIRVSAQFVAPAEGQRGRVYYKESTESWVDAKDAGVIEPAPETLLGSMEIRGVKKVTYNVKVVPETTFASAGIGGATPYSITITGKVTRPAEPASLSLVYDALTSQIIGTFPSSTDGDIQDYLLYVVIGGVDTFVKNLGNARTFTYTPPSNWNSTINLKIFSKNWSNWVSLSGAAQGISPPTLYHVVNVALTKINVKQPDRTTLITIQGLVTFHSYDGTFQRGRVYYKKSTDSTYKEWVTISPDSSLESRFEIRGLAPATYNIKVVPENEFGSLTLAGATAYNLTVELQTSVLKLFDNPLSRPTDYGTGLYAGSWGTGGGEMFGTEVWIDRGFGYRKIGELSGQSIGGVTSTLLRGNGVEVGTKDTNNSVRVVLGSGALSTGTASDADVLSGKNNFFIGSERVGACTITLVSAGVYDLTNLFRGLGDTEHAITTHGTVEDVLLIDDTVVYLPIELSDIRELNVKAVSFGQTLSDVASTSYTPRGDSIRPRILRDLFLVRDANYDWLIQALANPRPWEEPARYLLEILNLSTGALVDIAELRGAVSMAAQLKLVSSYVIQSDLLYDDFYNVKYPTPVVNSYTDKNNIDVPTGTTVVNVECLQYLSGTDVKVDCTFDVQRDGSGNEETGTALSFEQAIKLVCVDDDSTIASLSAYAVGSPADPGDRYIKVRNELTSTNLFLKNSYGYGTEFAIHSGGERFSIVLSGGEIRFYRNWTAGAKPLAIMAIPSDKPFPWKLSFSGAGGADILNIMLSDYHVSTVYAARQQLEKFGSTQAELRVRAYQISPYPQITAGATDYGKGSPVK